MLYKYIKLVKYKLMPLLGSDTFEHTFTSNLVLVEGRNGSGKSSLFNVMSVLPADKNMFYEGGYMELHVYHKKVNYKLISDFTNKSPKYEFWVEDENLNVAGLVSAQKELAKEHFNITQGVHEIMTDKETLTDMSIPARKKLLSGLTRMNIDSVLRNYSKLNEQLNLHKLMLKTEQNSFKIEESKLMDDLALKDVRESIISNNRSIDILLDTRQQLLKFQSDRDLPEELSNLSRLLKERQEVYSRNYNLLMSYPNREISERLQDILINRTKLQSRRQEVYSSLEKLNTLKGKIESNTTHNGENIKDVINKKQLVIDSLMNTSKYLFFGDGLTNEIDNAFINIADCVSEVVGNMMNNPRDDKGSLYFNKEKFALYTEEVRKLQHELSELAVIEGSVHDRQKLLDDLEGSLLCPNCHESMSIKHIISFTDVKERLSALFKRRAEIDEKLKDLNHYRESCSEYFTHFDIVMKCRRLTGPVIPEFWKEVVDGGILFNDVNKLSSMVTVLSVEIHNLRTITELNGEVRELRSKLEIAESLQGTTVEEVESEIEKLHIEDVEINTELHTLENESRCINYTLEKYNLYNKITDYISEVRSNIQKSSMSHVVDSVIETLDEFIRDQRFKTNNLTRIVSEQENISYGITKMKEKISDIEESIEVISAILEELSPKTGIIAKTISSFLNTIISHVNATLARIWSYKMVLTPIDISTDVLNYKFKVEVEDTLSNDDVKESSKGMKEAINLAFKCVLYKLLQFDNYPLYLDELGSNMDQVHTEMIGRLIHNFSMDDSYSQIFIISHKENMGFLREAEVISLS